MKFFNLLFELFFLCFMASKENSVDIIRESDSTSETTSQFDLPFYNTALSIDQGITDSVSRLSLQERTNQMMYNVAKVFVDLPNCQRCEVQPINLAPNKFKNIIFTLKPKVFKIVNNAGRWVFDPDKFMIHLADSCPMKRSKEPGAQKMSTGIITHN